MYIVDEMLHENNCCLVLLKAFEIKLVSFAKSTSTKNEWRKLKRTLNTSVLNISKTENDEHLKFIHPLIHHVTGLVSFINLFRYKRVVVYVAHGKFSLIFVYLFIYLNRWEFYCPKWKMKTCM